jgi:hypothetical protein
MKVCPDCKTAYSDDFEQCESCDIPLLDAPESLPENPELRDVVEVAPDEETAMVDLEAMEDRLRERAVERAEEEAEAGASSRDDPEATGTMNLSQLQKQQRTREDDPVGDDEIGSDEETTQRTRVPEQTLASLPPEDQTTSKAPVFIAVSVVAAVAIAGVAVALWVLFAQGAPVSISSIPSGASVLIDGKEFGAAPVVTKVRRGAHTVELRLEGYVTFKEIIDVTQDGLNLAQELAPVKPKEPELPDTPDDPPDDPPDNAKMSAVERDAEYRRIMTLIDERALDEAFEAIKTYVRGDPEDPRGDQLFDALAKARASKLRPKNPGLSAKQKLAKADKLFAEGEAAYARRAMGDARMKLLQALQYNPKLSGPHRVLARIYLSQGNEKRVRYHLERYLRLGGKDRDRAVRRWLEDHPEKK